MTDRPFRAPIFLELGGYANFRASSPWEALDYLEQHWRAPKGPAYQRACSACQSAIDGWLDTEVAHGAVMLAAREAGVLQPAWRSAGTAASAAA